MTLLLEVSCFCCDRNVDLLGKQVQRKNLLYTLPGLAALTRSGRPCVCRVRGPRCPLPTHSADARPATTGLFNHPVYTRALLYFPPGSNRPDSYQLPVAIGIVEVMQVDRRVDMTGDKLDPFAHSKRHTC